MPLKQVVVITKLKPVGLKKSSRNSHRKTLKKVLVILKKRPLRYRIIDRKHLKGQIRADLIVTVGGDGTVLAASHHAGETPVLGINSDPKRSTGFFCLSTPNNFEKHIEAILKGSKKPSLVPRLEVSISGKSYPYLGLNELLFASKLQGETARYRIQVGKLVEEHKSSGVWVATGAGSTAAIYSAGGEKDSPFSNRLQYRVREPFAYPKGRYRLLGGFIKKGETITIQSKMNQGMIFIDGTKLNCRIPKNSAITVKQGGAPLKIFLGKG